MRLASDATSVPAPPTFTPMSRACHDPVKCDSSTAAGTLLMTWLVAALTIRADPSMTCASSPSTAGMRAMLPANTKKQAKVSSNPQSTWRRAFRSRTASTPTTTAVDAHQGTRRSTDPTTSKNSATYTAGATALAAAAPGARLPATPFPRSPPAPSPRSSSTLWACALSRPEACSCRPRAFSGPPPRTNATQHSAISTTERAKGSAITARKSCSGIS